MIIKINNEDTKVKIIHHFDIYYPKDGGFTSIYYLKDNKFFVGVSFCSRGDMFCKKTGRELAIDRLINNPIIVPKSILIKKSYSYNLGTIFKELIRF